MSDGRRDGSAPGDAGRRSAATPDAAPVHVVVVSYRTPELLDRCLRSLEQERAAGRVAVTVVDNAPGDGSAELVRDRHPHVTLLEPGVNLGFGPAVNLGARAGAAPDAPWVVPANADVAVTTGAVDALLRAADADPGAGILAPRLVGPDGRVQHTVHPFPTAPFTVAFNAGIVERSARLRARYVLEGSWDPDRPRRVPWAHGALLLVRRATWDAIGGFDEHRWMYAEDLDLSWRAARAGWATRYVPGATVLHEIGAATGAAWGDGRTRRTMAATYRWSHDRRGRATTAVIVAANVIGAGARWIAGAPPGRAVHRGWLDAHLGAARDVRRDATASAGPPAAASSRGAGRRR
ncbi:MAG: glycosyltransferase family 2 protein [Solirubrobacteraceae bacterium]|nr:glycosyltransferase family 2 protein [Solirubrobacteraceae bacterium]